MEPETAELKPGPEELKPGPKELKPDPTELSVEDWTVYKVFLDRKGLTVASAAHIMLPHQSPKVPKNTRFVCIFKK